MLRVGIAGCGSIVRQRHAPEYTQNPNAEIAGFYDFTRQRAEDMARDFGGAVYESFDAMLADPSVDAVSVCAPNLLHCEFTVKALRAGKHVLCEKPMAVTLADCEAMLAEAKSSGKRLCVGHNQRLAPAHARAKRILDSGELGRVISFQSTFGHRGPEQWSADKSASTWFFKRNAAALGSVSDLGIHKLDLLLYLIASPLSSVYARVETLDKKFPDGSPIEVDDNSIMLLSFASGAMGTVTTSWTHYGEECNATVLYCEKGIMRMYSDPKYALEIVYADKTRVHYELEAMQTNEDSRQSSSGVIDTFVEGILTGNPTALDADDTFDSMRALFACLESAATGKPVTL